jgi:hypothetical protein
MRLDVVVLGIIATVLFIVLRIIAPILSKVLADECKAWMPCFTKCLICRAIAWMPEDQRERYKEEWQSHIDEMPGDIGKIVTAAGFAWAAKRMSRVGRVALSGTCTAHADNSGKLFIAVTGKVETSGRVFPRFVRQCPKCGKTFPVSGNKILCNDCDDWKITCRENPSIRDF